VVVVGSERGKRDGVASQNQPGPGAMVTEHAGVKSMGQVPDFPKKYLSRHAGSKPTTLYSRVCRVGRQLCSWSVCPSRREPGTDTRTTTTTTCRSTQATRCLISPASAHTSPDAERLPLFDVFISRSIRFFTQPSFLDSKWRYPHLFIV
jgi:hypothetical protein